MQKKLNRTKALSVVIIALGLLSSFAGDIIYVNPKGTEISPYESEATAAKTVYTALSAVTAERNRIKLVGTVQETKSVTLANVEVFADGWSDATWKGQSNSDVPIVTLGENAFVHGIKFNGWRVKGGLKLTADTACVSNCWVSGMYYSTGGEPAGVVSAGLVTHTLYSDNSNNNSGSTLLTVSGTAKMRNCVITGNEIKGNSRGSLNGIMTVSGSAEVENCVVYGNTTTATKGGDADAQGGKGRNGAGIYVPSGSPTIRNCIVRNNKKPHTPSDGLYPTESGEEIYTPSEEGNFYIATGATPTIENCNTVEGQVPECAVNCQTGDPQFSDAAARNFAIAATSPCVDVGLFREWQNTATDYSGVSARYQGAGVDIGAYEVTKSPTPVKAYVEIEGEAIGLEKYAMLTLKAVIAGSLQETSETFSWYTADPREGSPAPIAMGKVAMYRFTAGSWTLYLKVKDANGAGKDIVVALPNAVVVLPGADYYVSATGDDEASGDIDAPFATLTHAVETAGATGKKIKIVGTVTQNTQLVLENVEIYGNGRTDSCIHHTAGYVKPVFMIKGNTHVHGLKFTSGSPYLRCMYYLTDSSSVISNCWFSGLYCNTLTQDGEIAGHATAGLITHCLFSGNHSNNGGGEALKYGLGILSLSGTARMVNSVFTGNYHSNNTRGPNDGLLTMADNAVLENCVIYDNWAKSSSTGDNDKEYYRPRNGAGVCVRSGSPVIRNCIIRKNLKPHAYSPDGGDIYNPTEEGDIYIASGATPKISYCNLPEGQVPAGATNCQTGDPLFTDADNATLSKRDFSIAEGSPCRNAGGYRYWQKFATDYTGTEPRRQGGRVDIGAYEYPDGVIVPGLILILR